MDQRIVQGKVGARANHPVAVCLGGGDGDSRVDIGELCTILHGLQDGIHRFNFDCLENIAAIKDNVPAVLVVHPHLRVRVAEQRPAGGVDRPLAQGVVSEMVWGLNGTHEGFAHVGAQIGPLAEDHRMPTILVDNGSQPVGDVIEGFIPAGFSPFAGSTPAGADERGLQSFGIIE